MIFNDLILPKLVCLRKEELLDKENDWHTLIVVLPCPECLAVHLVRPRLPNLR